MKRTYILAAVLLAAVGSNAAGAYELGSAGWSQKPGLTLGAGTAGSPAPGIYMFEQFVSYAAHLVGPTAPQINGSPTQLRTEGAGVGFIIAPGWEFLGATYNAVVVQPFASTSLSAPINQQLVGMHNTYIVPAELSWKLGQSGFFVKTGLGIWTPDGTTVGPNGLGSIGDPWWTFQPELVVSYLKGGWNFTAWLFGEINTRNSITDYRSGDLLHAEFTAAKTIDKWTFGAVGYYVGQVTSDQSSAYYKNVINTQSYDIWAVGGRVSYDFGPVALNVWGLKEVSTHVVGASPLLGTVQQGTTVYASLSYKIWSFDEAQTPRAPLFHK
jgi:hypothetical protein